MQNKIVFIQDTREKKPFDFSVYGYEQIVKKLHVSDYSIQGYEDKIGIERKKNLSELYSNLIKNWKTFSKELFILSKYDLAQIVVEAPLSTISSFPVNCGFPSKILPIVGSNKNYLIKQIDRVISEYNIPILFLNNRTEAQLHIITVLEDYVRQRINS